MIQINRAIIPHLLTVGNLMCGFLALRYVAEGRYVPAAWLILLGATLDNLDGRIARMIGRDSAFGIELDSLTDVVTFGVVPAFMLYHSLLNSAWGAVLAFVFLVAGALRLARFNVMSHESGKADYFTGLPIPAAAITLSQFVIFSHHSWESAHAAQVGVMVTMGLAALMVSRIEYDTMPSFRSGGWWDRCKQLFLLGAIVLVVHPATSKDFFFPLALAYLAVGVLRSVTGLFSDEVTQHA